jgi:hypothetical protein
LRACDELDEDVVRVGCWNWRINGELGWRGRELLDEVIQGIIIIIIM